MWVLILGEHKTFSSLLHQVDAATNVRLELLDVGADVACDPWGRELPVRLREMHSHWLCRQAFPSTCAP